MQTSKIQTGTFGEAAFKILCSAKQHLENSFLKENYSYGPNNPSSVSEGKSLSLKRKK